MFQSFGLLTVEQVGSVVGVGNRAWEMVGVCPEGIMEFSVVTLTDKEWTKMIPRLTGYGE
jgi:hypothetical protein